MKCPRDGGFLFRERDPYGATEVSCINCGWSEVIGFVPITEDPHWRDHVREGHIGSPRMTNRSIDAQEREHQQRLAWSRITARKIRMKAK